MPPGPALSADERDCIVVEHPTLGIYHCHFDGDPELLFCDNDTNAARLYDLPSTGYSKDAFHEYVIHGNHHAVNPLQNGTKATGHFSFTVAAHGQVEVRVRLGKGQNAHPFNDFDQVFAARHAEADEFYGELQKDLADDDAKLIQRQALAGMIWSKQFYYYDVPQWLKGDPAMPAPPPGRRHGRNHEWFHLNNADIISMPDKWEYPWYAAWDLAFHCVALALVDPVFAKNQLLLMTRVWYMHPNGQIPAYEWAFGDVNPPVHAWAVWEVYKLERDANGGDGDRDFLERVLHKLIVNFTWWINRKDVEGHNVFQGGFLGLDNIGVFDRSAPLPTGGHINQADGTSWMAMYCLNLMRIALELAQYNHTYEDIATKFFEHFLYIAAAMNNIGDQGVGLWDEDDQFFYDVLRFPDGQMMPLKVRSMVGLIPLYAVEILEPELLDKLPDFKRRLEWFLDYRPDLRRAGFALERAGPRQSPPAVPAARPSHEATAATHARRDRVSVRLRRAFAVTRAPANSPTCFHCMNDPLSVQYQPAESDSGLFGGNSNWRGPIWFPVNYLLVTSLRRFAEYYGDGIQSRISDGIGAVLSPSTKWPMRSRDA